MNLRDGSSDISIGYSWTTSLRSVKDRTLGFMDPRFHAQWRLVIKSEACSSPIYCESWSNSLILSPNSWIPELIPLGCRGPDSFQLPIRCFLFLFSLSCTSKREIYGLCRRPYRRQTWVVPAFEPRKLEQSPLKN